jgi:signal recognition particle receptor subunit beta
MALFNYATKEITLKIVYYGPGLSGKTTNIEYLHSTFDPKRRGKLLSLSTEADRTLFFDFLPVEIGKIKDFSIRFQLYTVPGQVRYNSTRKLVLKGADAVVFVADSQKEMMEANLESLENMKENLMENNLDPEDIPIVFQYNKRDLPSTLTIDELNKELNVRDCKHFESVAIEGKGVQEAFETVTRQVLKHIAKKHRIDIESKDLHEGRKTEEISAASAIPEPTVELESPSTEAIQAEPAQTINIEEPMEAEAVVSSEELAGTEKIPSLEDLQKEMAQGFEEEQASEAESILEPSEEFLDLEELSSTQSIQNEDEEVFTLEEPSIADTEVESEKLDLVSSEFDETETDQLENLQDQEEILEGSTIEEFEPEGPSDDFAESSEEGFTETVEEEFIDTTEEKQEPEIKDDSIESIYKAFMSNEMEEEKTDIPSIDKEGAPPPISPMEEPAPITEEMPSADDVPSLDAPFKKESFTPPVEPVQEKPTDDKVGEIDALKDFSDSISPSHEEERAAPVSAPSSSAAEATQNVILDEINALSKTLGKMNNSISSLKSELNVLSDKVLEIEKSYSSLSNQTGEIKEALENGSGSGMQLSAETLQTIMELKKTIDRAKKKKFWLLFS